MELLSPEVITVLREHYKDPIYVAGVSMTPNGWTAYIYTPNEPENFKYFHYDRLTKSSVTTTPYSEEK